MSVLVSSTKQRPIATGPAGLALAIVAAVAIALAGAFALNGRGAAESGDGSVAVPNAFPALREHQTREWGGAPAGNEDYTPLSRVHAE